MQGMQLQLRPPKPEKPKVYTRKRWIKDLLDKREVVERAIGAPIGQMLGCGHFGCVFRSTEPWVVKLSVDPTEGPIWAHILNLIEEEEWGGEGFARVKDIVRLQPGVGAGKRKRQLFAIVREDCEPLMRGEGWSLSDYTYRRLLLPTERSYRDDFPYYYLNKKHWDDGAIAELLIQKYGYTEGNANVAEMRCTELAWTLSGLEAYRRLQLEHDQRLPIRRTFSSDDLHRFEHLTYRMKGGVGEYLGDSLRMLLSNEVVMRDLHLNNVGWRVHEQIGEDWSPDCLVIYDPGHTPTEAKTEISEKLIANGRWLG